MLKILLKTSNQFANKNGKSGTYINTYVPKNGKSGTYMSTYVPENAKSGTYIFQNFSYGRLQTSPKNPYSMKKSQVYTSTNKIKLVAHYSYYLSIFFNRIVRYAQTKESRNFLQKKACNFTCDT